MASRRKLTTTDLVAAHRKLTSWPVGSLQQTNAQTRLAIKQVNPGRSRRSATHKRQNRDELAEAAKLKAEAKSCKEAKQLKADNLAAAKRATAAELVVANSLAREACAAARLPSYDISISTPLSAPGTSTQT